MNTPTFFTIVVSLGSTFGFFASGPSLASSELFTTLGFSLARLNKTIKNEITQTCLHARSHLLYIMMLLAKVGEHVSLVTIYVSTEDLDVPGGTKLIHFYHEVLGASSQANLKNKTRITMAMTGN